MALALGLLQPVRGHVGFAAQDGLHPVLLRLLIELQGSEQVAMVGHGHLFHAEGKQAGKQLVKANRPVQQAVLRVQMKVRELAHFARPGLLALAAKINDAKLWYDLDPVDTDGFFRTGSCSRALGAAGRVGRGVLKWRSAAPARCGCHRTFLHRGDVRHGGHPAVRKSAAGVPCAGAAGSSRARRGHELRHRGRSQHARLRGCAGSRFPVPSPTTTAPSPCKSLPVKGSQKRSR
jgi:hypothetical protein